MLKFIRLKTEGWADHTRLLDHKSPLSSAMVITITKNFKLISEALEMGFISIVSACHLEAGRAQATDIPSYRGK